MIDLFARFSDRCFGEGSWQRGGNLDQAASSVKWGMNIIGKIGWHVSYIHVHKRKRLGFCIAPSIERRAEKLGSERKVIHV